jgi:hypothetical protein
MRTIKKDENTLKINNDGTYESNLTDSIEIEETFSVKIENGKITEEPIWQLGIGQGAGDWIRGKARWIIEEILENISSVDAYKKASDWHEFSWNNGFSAINLEAGSSNELFGHSLGNNECNQACDNNYIDIICISSSDESNFYYMNDEDYQDLIECYILEDEEFSSLKDFDFENNTRSEFFEAAEEIYTDKVEELKQIRFLDFYGAMDDDSFEYMIDRQRIKDELNSFYADIEL